ncbi:hypothetical protein BZG36_05367 [Bifiguratus adelaidae]|uniref:glucan endo-1,3-beta-D-glucosidase n=1 Tax=Bifiguratus adelaidae TaxID=1938954 RepID=A0A261XTX2_9FUNG|nr:hypothetical protein BZG36_05367 [Bifiguratus adelaidae]
MRYALAGLVALLCSDVALAGSLNSVTYTHVGGSGSYEQVTHMQPGVWPSCTANIQKCVKKSVQVSGKLAPFDDELTFAFSGPMRLRNIAVYQPTGKATAWNKVSSWSPSRKPTNLVFMNNMGGGKSGEWDICAGASQSYASGDWTKSVARPNEQLFSGWLQPGYEINIMTDKPCSSKLPCRGFARGTANHGWAGSKLIAIELEAPYGGNDGSSIWALNAQVVRSAQYGCNCRGMGSPGGCGEIDLMETLVSGNTSRAFSEIYSFKGATGTGSNHWWDRPVQCTVFIAIFDVEKDLIQLMRLPTNKFSFSSSKINEAQLLKMLKSQGLVVPFH